MMIRDGGVMTMLLRMEAEVLKVAKKVATQEEELNEQHNTLDTLVHDLHTS